jgi:large subunit ribosomal protein L10
MPSPKILEQKKAQVQEISQRLKSSCAGVLVDYKGINVADDTILRKELREAGVSYSVIKNTLLCRAFEQAGIEGFTELLKGTTALAVSNDDHIISAKLLCAFASKNKIFKIKAGFIDGLKIEPQKVQELAKLPSREVLVAKALGGLNAPITGFVFVLNGTLKSLVVALNAIAQKKPA